MSEKPITISDYKDPNLSIREEKPEKYIGDA